MKMRVVAVALLMMLAAAPAKAAEYITYEGLSRGTATFFDNLSPNPPITKAIGYAFNYIVPLDPNVDPKARIEGSRLILQTEGSFFQFDASACLTVPSSGGFPTSQSGLVQDCGTISTFGGKNSGYSFYGDIYAITASVSNIVPERTGLIEGGGFFDLPPSAIPEPATWFMMLVGLGMVGGTMRRRGRAQIATA